MAYSITRDYIRKGNSRPGTKNGDIKFIVSHDTGNPGSTAYANRNYFNNSQPSASAHAFVDDKYILEIIPLDEVAYHVRNNVTTDNRMFGANANNAAIGIELCFGGRINFTEAYKRYVWYHAYLLDLFNLNPDKHIVAHSTLDPSRRRDPQNALQQHGISWQEFLNDVKATFQSFKGNKDSGSDGAPTPKPPPAPQVKGVTVSLPLREGDKGQFVREVQQDLIKAGFPLPRFGADGTFGEETEVAVMRFQRKYGLAVDGLVGPNTLNKLNEVLSEPRPVTEFPLPSSVLRKGDRGEGVKQVQRALKQINFDPGQIDGIYGQKTEDAVRRFQSMYATLADDGVYGPNTRKYIQLELEEQD